MAGTPRVEDLTEAQAEAELADLARRLGAANAAYHRDDAPEILRFFADQGVHLKVISGDNVTTVEAVASRAGVPHASSAPVPVGGVGIIVFDAVHQRVDPVEFGHTLMRLADFVRGIHARTGAQPALAQQVQCLDQFGIRHGEVLSAAR